MEIFNLHPERAYADGSGSITLANLPDLFGKDGGCQGGYKFIGKKKVNDKGTEIDITLKYDLEFVVNPTLKSQFKNITFQKQDRFLWEWVKGGKLPGLELRSTSESNSVSGGISKSEVSELYKKGCTIRPMWRKSGKATLYAYFNDMDKALIHSSPAKGGVIPGTGNDSDKFFGYEQTGYNADYFFSDSLRLIENSDQNNTSEKINIEINIKGNGINLKMTYNTTSFYQSVKCPSKLLDGVFDVRLMLHFFYGGDDETWAPKFLSAVKVSNLEFNGTKYIFEQKDNEFSLNEVQSDKTDTEPK